MANSMAIDQMVERDMLSAVEAAGTMCEKQLYGYFLVVVYSTIDTLGLLGTPSAQISATGRSFKDWVQRYFLPQTDSTYSATDLWAARCAVLHTFTTESDLSRSGKARQLQYYFSDKDGAAARHFVTINNQIDEGAHVAVHLGDFGEAFLKSMQSFVPVLLKDVVSNGESAARLKNVLQLHPMDPAP